MARIKYQEAIGLEVKRGRPPAGPAPSKADLVKLYVREGRAIRDIAEALGCSKDAVHRALRKYGIEARTCERRSALEKADPARLYSDLIEKGVEGTAAGLGVTKRTLQYFLAKKRRPGEKRKAGTDDEQKGRITHDFTGVFCPFGTNPGKMARRKGKIDPRASSAIFREEEPQR